MRALAVAKKDFIDAVRSKTIWALTAVFIVFAAGLTFHNSSRVLEESGGSGSLTLFFLVTLVPPVVALIPLTSLVISTKSIVGERESGTINFLMSLPYTRADILFGKYLGRITVISLAIVTGFVVSAVVFAIELGTFDLVQFSMFTCLSILLGMVFVSIGIGASSVVDSTIRATVLAGGLFVFVGPVWPTVLRMLPDSWKDEPFFVFLERLQLQDVFTDAFITLIETPEGMASSTTANSLPDGIQMAFYFQDWFAFVILALWITLPLAIGYYRFSRSEL